MFGFPSAERSSSFKYNILQSALFQIGFPDNSKIMNNKSVLVKQLSEKYPNFNDITSQQISTSIDGMTTTSAPYNTGIEFRNKDNTKVLTLTQNRITLIIFGKVYTNFSAVLEEFDNSLIPIIQDLDISQLNRVAIRKINLIDVVTEGNKKDLKSLMSSIFNKSLVSNTQTIPSNDSLEQSLSHLIFSNADNYNLHMQYGLAGKHLQEQNIKQLVYDIDIYKADTKVSISELKDEFQKINSEVYNIFVWGINDNFMQQAVRG